MNEILQKLDVVIVMQQELLTLMKAMDAKSALPDALPEEIWLTKPAVMDLLCIGERTFYRRLADGKWEKRKNGGSWYYLKSSLYEM
jgi:hypothetical protein